MLLRKRALARGKTMSRLGESNPGPTHYEGDKSTCDKGKERLASPGLPGSGSCVLAFDWVRGVRLKRGPQAARSAALNE